MTKITIFQKLLVGIIVMLMLNSIIAFVGILNVNELERTAKIMIDKSKERNEIQSIKLNFFHLINPANDFLIHGNKIEIVNFKQFDSIIKTEISKLKNNNAIDIKQSFITNLEKNFNEIEFLVIRIFNLKNPIGNHDGAIIMADVDAITNKVIKDLNEILIVESTEMNQYLNKNQATKIKTTKIIIIVGFFLALGLVVGGFFYVREITQPIKHLKQMAQKIALGDLTLKADVKTRVQDEIDDFSKSFNNMIGILEQTTVSRAYFNNIINRMVDTLIITDSLGKIRVVNKAAVDLLEYSESELMGQSFAKVITKKKIKNGFSALDLINKIKTEKEQNVYNTYFSKSKKAIPVSFSQSLIYDKKKNIKGILCIAQHNPESIQIEKNKIEDISKADLRNLKTIGKVPLTKRELEIVKLITSELSNREIAEKLFISVRTVETHRKNIMQKLHTKSVIALVHYAVRNEII